jgi:hypothetical protein
VAAGRLREVLLAARAEADLEGLVAVAIGGAHLHDGARTRLDHGDGNEVAALHEALGHSEFLADEAEHGFSSSLLFAVVRPVT